MPQGRAEVATLILAGTSAPFGCQRLDIWGLGMVLYESATGHRPSRRARPDVQLRKHAAPVRSLRRMPAAFAATIDACLEPDPADRPTVADIEAILEPLAANV